MRWSAIRFGREHDVENGAEKCCRERRCLEPECDGPEDERLGTEGPALASDKTSGWHHSAAARRTLLPVGRDDERSMVTAKTN